MLDVQVYLLPQLVPVGALAGHTAVVLDILRATTTITAALDAGIVSCKVAGSTDEARSLVETLSPRPLLCGEEHALAPPGFDLGNSPRQFQPVHRGRSMVLSSTNGTRAILAARPASGAYAGALVNAAATAAAGIADGRPVAFICSGTEGEVSLEDCLGAGAIIDAMKQRTELRLIADSAMMAQALFASERKNLLSVLRQTIGGRNNIRVGLGQDIDFAARLDAINLACRVDLQNMEIHPVAQAD